MFRNPRDPNEEKPVIEALNDLPAFKVESAASDDFNKFYKQFAYFILDLDCPEAEFLAQNSADTNEPAESLAQSLKATNFFQIFAHDNRIQNGFDAEEFKNNYERALKEFARTQGEFEQIYNAHLYFFKREQELKLAQANGGSDTFNEEDYEQFRKVYQLPPECFLFEKVFGENRQAMEAQYLKDNPEETIAKSFLTEVKQEGGEKIRLKDNKFFTFSGESKEVSVAGLQTYINSCFANKAVALGSAGNGKEYTPAGDDKCRVHVACFNLPAQPADANAQSPEPPRQVKLVAADRVNKAGERNTVIHGVPGDLRGLEWEVYLKMAETILLNIIFSRPPKERCDPIVFHNINPDAPLELWAAVQFHIENTNRINIVFNFPENVKEVKNAELKELVKDISDNAGKRGSKVDPLLEIDDLIDDNLPGPPSRSSSRSRT